MLWCRLFHEYIIELFAPIVVIHWISKNFLYTVRSVPNWMSQCGKYRYFIDAHKGSSERSMNGNSSYASVVISHLRFDRNQHAYLLQSLRLIWWNVSRWRFNSFLSTYTTRTQSTYWFRAFFISQAIDKFAIWASSRMPCISQYRMFPRVAIFLKFQNHSTIDNILQNVVPSFAIENDTNF